MSTAKLLSSSGFRTFPDNAQIVHHRYAPKARECARRFARFRSRISKRKHNTKGIYAARLVALDMIMPSFIEIAVTAIPCRFQGKPVIEWRDTSDDRLDRRYISDLTILSWRWSEEAAKTKSELLELLAEDPDYKNITTVKVLEILEGDFCHWASRNLSGPLYAHVCGITFMHPVSRDTLTRLERKLTRKVSATEIDQDYELKVADFEDAASEACAQDDTETLINYTINLIENASGKTEKEKFKNWALNIASLIDRVREASVNTAIILCYMLSIAESGTYLSSDAPLSTRIRYIKNGPIIIHRRLRALGIQIDEASEEQLHALYTSITEDPNLKDPSGTRASISNFRHFAEDEWGITAVNLYSSDSLPPIKPRVQIIHKHEIELCLRWLKEYQGADSYLLQIACIQLQLMYCFPMRVDELRYVRLKNLTVNDDKSIAELELYPASRLLKYHFRRSASERPQTL